MQNHSHTLHQVMQLRKNETKEKPQQKDPKSGAPLLDFFSFFSP